MSDSRPVTRERSEDAVAAAVAAAAPAFAPGWRPDDGGPGGAVVRVFARYIDALAARIDAAPDKNRLAFFEQLGIELSPAQAARAPVVFEAIPNVGDSTVPARTRVGAAGPDGNPLVFETERAIALAAAPLVDVVSVWPARDAFADHSAAALRREPFALFEPLRPVPHVFYLAHEVLAIAGESTVEIDVELETGAGEPLAIAWEHWDGEDWRPFKPFATAAGPRESLDATAGLTRSGLIRLAADCGKSLATRVDGIEAVWVRGRLTRPLPPDGPALAAIRRIALRSTVDRSLPPVACGALPEPAGLLPDAGVGGVRPLDFSGAVQPLGAQPRAGDAFYLAFDEGLGRPGADVTLCFTKVDTADEVVDQLGAEYEEDANNAQRVVLRAAIDAARALLNAGRGVLAITRRAFLPALPAPLPAVYERLEDAGNDLEAAIAVAELELQDALANDRGVDLEAILDPLVDPARAVAYWLYNVNAPPNPPEGEPDPPLPPPPVGPPEMRRTGLENPQPFNTGPFPFPIPGWPWLWGTTPFVGATVQDMIDAAAGDPLLFAQRLVTFIAHNEARVTQAGTFGRNAASAANASLAGLDILTPIDAVRAAGVEPPLLPDPVVAWEYWNGDRWRTLAVAGSAEARTFRGDGPVTFTVPGDLEPVEVNGDERRWIRARLVSGGYGIVRIVSWRDEKTQKLNFFPVVQVRPPSLGRVRLGYRHRSPWVEPAHAIAYNDFRWVEHTGTLRERRDAVRPFEPVEDRTPSLYFGFDGRLPADRIGLFLGVREDLDRPEGPRLVWEAWTGEAWETVPAEDGTRGLAVPGIATALWPGTPVPPSARILEARGTVATAESPAHAARFAAGDAVLLRQGPESELARVVGVDERRIRLRTPLDGDYRGATLELAALPRFGAPRSWLRVRLAADGPPPRPWLDALAANAVWAAHTETREDERLGGSNGQPDQVVFARARPVLEDEVLEVRELEGGRAHVEEPILRQELEAAGVPRADVRTTTDPRTGRIDAVWVRWRRRASLLFAPAGARAYAIEHSRGRILFGDGERGRVPPAGTDNLRFRSYRTGGGVAGNVHTGAIDQVLAGVLAGGVRNALPAQGGADVEPLDRLRRRGPTVVRHRSQAITASDYEALALQASPAVAVARALPTTHPSGRHAPGWVTLRIVPHGSEPRPSPSFELRDRVRRYIAARAPAAIAHQVTVRPAEFLPVGVTAAVATVGTGSAAAVRDAVIQALRKFLHPLTGGPGGLGWPFGRDVFLSDVAALLEGLPGVDYLATLGLDRDGEPAGERVAVPADRMVAAGPLRVTLTGE